MPRMHLWLAGALASSALTCAHSTDLNNPAAPSLDTPWSPGHNCDSATTDPTELFRRGSSLITPYMVLSDRPVSAVQPHVEEVRKGIACLEKAIQLRPDYWQALWVRGKAYQALGDMRDARDSFGSAYALNPENPDVGRELVIAHIELSEFSEAVSIAKRLADTFPKDAGLRANYALALALDGQIAAAQVTIADALHLDPADPVTRALKVRIDDIASGKRTRPTSIRDLER